MRVPQRSNWELRKLPIGAGAAAVFICLIVGVMALTPTQLLYVLLAGLILVGIVAAHSFENMLVLYIWIISLVHLLKRAIFLLGPQSQFTYYSVLFLPTFIYIPVLLLAVRRVGPGWKLTSTRLLVAFVAWSLLITLLPAASDQTWKARLAAVHERVLPMAAFAIGLAAPLYSSTFRKMARAILYSAGVSVAYGVILYLNGPTVLEREWARGTATYSLQGQKVLEFILGSPGINEWRGFSYYADALTWGLFLVTAVAVAMILKNVQPHGLRMRSLVIWIPILLLGLFVCLTRTPWAGLLVMIATYVALQWRHARRPAVLAGIILAGFVVVIRLGSYFYETVWWMMPSSETEVVRRYTTIGTLEARIKAWDGLKQAVVDYPVRGAGFGETKYFSRPMGGSQIADIGGHNFILETTVCTGVVGAVLFLGFILALLFEGSRALERSRAKEAVCWLLAFVVGYIMTGYLNGGNFMNVYFFILAGVLAAGALGRPDEEGAPLPIPSHPFGLRRKPYGRRPAEAGGIP